MKTTRTKDRAPHHANGTAVESADKAKSSASANGRRIQVRRSGVHGRGVYAMRDIKKGETIIEYKGEMITWKQAERRHPHNPDDPDHTFFFQIDEQHVIDAAVGGNAARWINHACNPNCESDVDEDNFRVFIKALRKIRRGEELFYDYGLVLDERYTPKVKKQFACRCGARDCRGTMLAPKR
jgi:SET domain-containing protein